MAGSLKPLISITI